jgi:hypothetical protein
MIPMTNISIWRLNLLRSGYLLMAVGLGLTIWPEILDPASSWALSKGIVTCMLGALGAVAVLGLRYPLKMLPLLFFEMAWKFLWLTRIALPLYSAHKIDDATAQTVFACGMVIIFPIIVPWDHVYRTYVTSPGDPWLRRRAAVRKDALAA